MRARAVYLALLLGTAIVLAGCSPHGATTTGGTAGAKVGIGDDEPPSVAGKYGGHLVDVTIADPKTFNVWLGAETSTTEALGPLYDALNDRNEYTLKFEPRLADRPEISSDGLTYTYKLKDGLVWSDGVPLTADDVIFTLDVLFDPKIDSNAREGMLIDVDQPD